MTVWVMAFVAVACTDTSGIDVETAAALERLDAVTKNHDKYIVEKERHLDDMGRHASSLTGDRLYSLYDTLFSEYFSLNLDSARRYAQLKVQTAVEIGDSARMARSYVSMARIAMSQGHDGEKREYMREAAQDTSVRAVRSLYLDAVAVDMEDRGENPLAVYRQLERAYENGSVEQIHTRSNVARWQGDYTEALEILDEDDSLLTSTLRNKAITYYLRGHINLLQGDTIAGIRNMAIAAASDLEAPVRDYRSLYELSRLLLTCGDVDRAYRYINLALRDVNAAKIYDNMRVVSIIMQDVIHAHELENQRQHERQQILLWAITLLSVVLAVLLVSATRSHHLAKHAADRETELNAHLKETNEKLNTLVSSLSESNQVKDTYIVQYFNLCSYFIGLLEQFRNSVSATSRTKGVEGVEKLLAHWDNENELKRFYANFDQTFLALFPHFIEDFNSLLQPDKQVRLNRDGSMTNELRTFALIRLGITDSEQIATFLRRSVSTIYNYRVKMRNASAVPRDTFETTVGKVGR